MSKDDALNPGGADSAPLLLLNTAIKKRSVTLFGHKTSISVEDDFWTGLKQIAQHLNKPINQILEELDSAHQHVGHTNLSSIVRLYVLRFYQDQN